MKQTMIEELRLIANDASFSVELQNEARKQLEILEPKVQQKASSTDTPVPTQDFCEFRLRPLWEHLPEPRQTFERWLNSAECKERIRQHDASVERKVAECREEPTTGSLVDDGVRDVLITMAEWEYSSRWQHPGMTVPTEWLALRA